MHVEDSFKPETSCFWLWKLEKTGKLKNPETGKDTKIGKRPGN